MSSRRVTLVLVCTAALLFTATGCEGVAGVLIPPVTSSPSPSPSGSPTPTSDPSPGPVPSPSPAASPTAPDLITLARPASGATLRVPFTASGTANTFEAALTVDVIDEVGDQLCVRNIMATSGSGTPGTWSTALAFAPTALTAQRATVRAYETSARDGSMVNLVERSVTISPMHPTVMLTSPSCGDRVAPGGVVVVSGLATVFEAVVTVELRDFGGAVVLTQTLLTSEGSVEAPFSGTVSIPASLPPAFYDVVAFNTSPKDGAVENEFAVQILVQP